MGADFYVHGGYHEFYVSFTNDDGSENRSTDDMNSMLATIAYIENVEWEAACEACNGLKGKWPRAPDTTREFAKWVNLVDWDSLPKIIEEAKH